MGKEILIAMNKKLNHNQKSKDSLIVQGVEKLKILGFSNATTHTILTDDIYQLYFLSFLNNISKPKNEEEIMAIKELKSFLIKLIEI